MEILLLRVTYLCQKFGVTFYAVEKACNLADSSIKKWGKSPPSCERLLRVAQYFGVSVDFLLGLTDNPKSHLNKEIFKHLSSELKEQISILQNQVTESNKNFCLNVDEKLMRFGLKNTANIDVDAQEVMNDPALPH